MELLVAACGHLCNKCPAYIGTLHNDTALIEKTAQEWSVLHNADIKADDVWCTGCMTDEGGRKCTYCGELCEIRKCAKGRGFETCAQCGERVGCATLALLVDNVPPAGQLLEALAAFRAQFEEQK